MNTSFYARFRLPLKSAALAILIALGAAIAPARVSADPVTYNFVQYEPFNYPFTGAGDIVVDSGNLIDGQLSFNGGPAIPISAWFQPGWNGSYLTAGLFNTPVGTVFATGPGTPAVQVFNSLSQGTTIVGSWVVATPEPTIPALLLTAGAGFVMASRRRKSIQA